MLHFVLAVTGLLLSPVNEVTIDRDDIRITESCTIRTVDHPIADGNLDGVIHLVGDDMTITFADDALLRGCDANTPADQMTGIGIVITGKNVTLIGAQVSGYRVGLHARNTDGLVVEHASFDDHYRQRLRSSPQREDLADWLSPHDNDANQWLTRYAASMWIEDSNNVIIRDVRIRNGQNGIVLDCVNDSQVYDCDCSFLSGWGLALWRSSRNVICRNALDFCIRGYSHGVYNRGQDSAGLLMFEQCNENLIAENSITHGGDGVFCFAGREALGEANPRADLNWYERRGCSGNLFYRNDLSYAAAHGLECTFSFDNVILLNRFAENAICGIWGGYSQNTTIASNYFQRNGDRGYGLERGGVNIEHGAANRMFLNQFQSDECGVHLWWDNDAGIFETPWYRANQSDAPAAIVAENQFIETPVAIHLRNLRRAVETASNTLDSVGESIRTEGDGVQVRSAGNPQLTVDAAIPQQLPGTSRPVGARDHLRGRHNIIMTEWGPWDHQSPLVRRVDGDADPTRHIWALHGLPDSVTVSTENDLRTNLGARDDGSQALTVESPGTGVHPYALRVRSGDFSQSIRGVFINAQWSVRFFDWQTDPRENADQWREEARDGVVSFLPALKLPYAGGGPSNLGVDDAVRNANLSANKFGTIATTTLAFPAGRWRIRTVSDDGIRVWLDDDVVIDDWTWHAPREHTHEFSLDAPRDIVIRVEHFELDGYAVLSLDIEQVAD